MLPYESVTVERTATVLAALVDPDQRRMYLDAGVDVVQGDVVALRGTTSRIVSAQLWLEAGVVAVLEPEPDYLPPHWVGDVVHFSAGADDAHGNPVRAESGRHTYAAHMVPRNAATGTASREVDGTVVDLWNLRLPAGAVVSAGDEWEQAGRRFTIEGTPDRRRTQAGERFVDCVIRYVGPVT